MKIENLKELHALVKLCRKAGINAIEVDGVKLSLGDAPAPQLGPQDTKDPVVEDTYNDQDVLFWSSEPHGS